MSIIAFLNRTFRPCIAWTCWLSLFLDGPVRMILSSLHISMAQVSLAEIAAFAVTILGLSACRTYEKKHGLTK
jgi:hypothetical protein